MLIEVGVEGVRSSELQADEARSDKHKAGAVKECQNMVRVLLSLR